MNKNISTKGKVLWITGLSGSGKTTVSRELYRLLSEFNCPVVVLDGDVLREALGSKWGYTPEERRELAKVYGRLCKLISDSGAHVICAAIAMFDEVRDWNRKNITNYFEVFLRVPIEVLTDRDTKGLYAKYIAMEDAESVLSDAFELPKSPDLTIDNFGSVKARAAALQICQALAAGSSTEIGEQSRDTEQLRTGIKDYWNSYYAKAVAPNHPSPFAEFCKSNYIKNGAKILEIGCGNGRDTFFFAKTNPVTAIDVSTEAVRINSEHAKKNSIDNVSFHEGALGSIAETLPDDFGVVYSRFVLHAMDEEFESRTIALSHAYLEDGGLFFAEFRTIRDPLAEEGVRVGRNERITDHYRRFINCDSVKKKLEEAGFEIVFAVEDRGFAKHKTEDPVCARIVARKRALT